MSSLATVLLPNWSRSFDKSMVVGLKIDRASLVSRLRDATPAKLRFVIDAKRLNN